MHNQALSSGRQKRSTTLYLLAFVALTAFAACAEPPTGLSPEAVKSASSAPLTPVISGTVQRADGQTIPVRIEVLQPNNNARIDPSNPETWLVIHGRISSSGTSSITAIAAAIKSKHPSAQVLLADWETGALDTRVFAILPLGPYSGGESWIEPVGKWAASALKNYGFDPSKLNLVGHSWGTYVAYTLAQALGGVNVIVALDPAADDPTNGSFNPTTSNKSTLLPSRNLQLRCTPAICTATRELRQQPMNLFQLGFWISA